MNEKQKEHMTQLEQSFMGFLYTYLTLCRPTTPDEEGLYHMAEDLVKVADSEVDLREEYKERAAAKLKGNGRSVRPSTGAGW